MLEPYEVIVQMITETLMCADPFEFSTAIQTMQVNLHVHIILYT